MFECRACVLRCIRAIAGDSSKPHNLARRQLLLTPRLLHQSPRRHASSTALATKPDHSDELIPGIQPIPDISRPWKVVKNDAKQKYLTAQDSKSLQIELKYLQDPVKLAEHVHYTLRDNKPEKALDLCRLASKKQEVVVSWNHVVDWHMAKGRVDEAIKIYNEMKKRAQFPDSYTYTILLRGLARKPGVHGSVVREGNVSKALSIYHSMSSPTSRVRPSIYHTNAVLKVCSAALDMDALWGIVSKLPSSGAGAPDHVTYAILLNAIRHGAFGRYPEHTPVESLAAHRNKAVQEGRRIWRDIIAKWRGGEVKIDEELVCAMGRLLLMSGHMRDWDDVLSLIQQTMKIERLIPPLGSPDRHTEHIPQENNLREPEAEAEEDSEGYKDTPATKAFYPVQPLPRDSAFPKRPTSLTWVQPANPTLSLLIGACTQLRIPKTATAYWDLFTNPSHFGIQPDIANFHAHLRLLGKNRASAQAVRLLREGMPQAGVVPKYQTFRIAMSVCVRDKNNHNALEHARAIVDVMDKTTADLDVHTLMQYLNLALGTDNGAKIVATLDRLDPIFHNLRSRVTYGADDPRTRTAEGHLVDKEETILFLQAMVGAIDTLMNRGLVGREDFRYWHGRRSQINQFVGKARGNVGRQRARVEHGRSESEGGAEVVAMDGAAGNGGEKVMGKEEYRRRVKKEGKVTAAEGMDMALKRFRRRDRVKHAREEETEDKSLQETGWGGGRRRTEIKHFMDDGGFADSPAELSMR